MLTLVWTDYKPQPGIPWVDPKWHECDFVKADEVNRANVTFVQFYDGVVWRTVDSGIPLSTELNVYTKWRYQGVHGDTYGAGWF